MADFLPQASTTDRTKRGHEANALVVRGLVNFAVVLVAVGFVVEFGLVYFMRDLSREEKALQALAPPRFADDSGVLPAPRLQARPASDFARMKEEELRRLNGYGWVDRAAGIAHIPIDRALDIVASSGVSAGGGSAGKNAKASPASRPASAAGETTGAGAPKDRKP